MYNEDENSSKNDNIEIARKDSTKQLINANQSSRTEGEQSFTFDHHNHLAGSIKSPASFINPNLFKKEDSAPNFDSVRPDQLFRQTTSPTLFLCQKPNTSKNGNMTEEVTEQKFENVQKKTETDQKLMEMLDEIGDIDDSLAATKEAIKGKAFELAHGDDEKKKKRKEKLKKKRLGLKLDIPSKNKFLFDTSNPPNDDKTSPVRKLYNPTPTKRLINFNLSESGLEPIYLNQLSNKGWNMKINESPFLYFQDSK